MAQLFWTKVLQTMMFAVNIVGHTIHKETDIENIKNITGYTLYFNPRYITLAFYIVGYNISIDRKVVCI